jgi:hypothetical protein
VNKAFITLKKALAWLEAKGIEDIEMTIEHDFNEIVSVRTYAGKVTRREAHLLKTLFCPNEIGGVSGSDKYIKGMRKISDDLSFRFVLYEAMTCEEMTEEQVSNMSDAEWDRFRARAVEGTVKIQNCAPPKYKDEPEDAPKAPSHEVDTSIPF